MATRSRPQGFSGLLRAKQHQSLHRSSSQILAGLQHTGVQTPLGSAKAERATECQKQNAKNRMRYASLLRMTKRWFSLLDLAAEDRRLFWGAPEAGDCPGGRSGLHAGRVLVSGDSVVW